MVRETGDLRLRRPHVEPSGEGGEGLSRGPIGSFGCTICKARAVGLVVVDLPRASEVGLYLRVPMLFQSVSEASQSLACMAATTSSSLTQNARKAPPLATSVSPSTSTRS